VKDGLGSSGHQDIGPDTEGHNELRACHLEEQTGIERRLHGGRCWASSQQVASSAVPLLISVSRSLRRRARQLATKHNELFRGRNSQDWFSGHRRGVTTSRVA
jgi:hypothetical protein